MANGSGAADDLDALVKGYVDAHDEEIHSVLVARVGEPMVEVYYEPYSPEDKHILNSCTKSFLSTLAGIALGKGYLGSVQDTALDYAEDFPDAGRDPRRARITIEHLLTMSSGIEWPQSAGDNASDRMVGSPDWIRFILDQPMASEPGVVTNYSNGDAHLLSALLERATGVPTVEFATEHLFAPLGITDAAGTAIPAG